MQTPQSGQYSVHWSLDPACVFLNHGSFGATPIFAQDEQRRWQTILENEPVRFFERIAPDAMLASRKAIAKMVNCDPDDMH